MSITIVAMINPLHFGLTPPLSRVNTGKLRLQRQPLELATIIAEAVENSHPAMEALLI